MNLRVVAPRGGRCKQHTGNDLLIQGMEMTIRLGELLIEQNVLTREQVRTILEEQKETRRPFGLLAETMFGISPQQIERAWAEQYRRMTPRVDLDEVDFDKAATVQVNRRQAWQFRILPLHFRDGELIIATTVEHMARALNFVTHSLTVPCAFVVVSANELGEHLCRRYPMPGMNAGDVEGNPFTRMLKTA